LVQETGLIKPHHIDPVGQAAGTEAVIDIYNSDPRHAGIQHRKERGKPAEA
jgi:hypothetical protein